VDIRSQDAGLGTSGFGSTLTTCPGAKLVTNENSWWYRQLFLFYCRR